MYCIATYCLCLINWTFLAEVPCVWCPPDFFWRNMRWRPTPVLLPGKPHGRRSLVGCSSWGRWRSDTTERLRFHFSLSRLGEGNSNPLQCCCLENPRDRGAWWVAVYGVAQSGTRLTQLSSSSSSTRNEMKYFALSQIPTGYLLFPDWEFHNFGSIINSYQWLLCCIMHCSGLSFYFKKLKKKKAFQS